VFAMEWIDQFVPPTCFLIKAKYKGLVVLGKTFAAIQSSSSTAWLISLSRCTFASLPHSVSVDQGTISEQAICVGGPYASSFTCLSVWVLILSQGNCTLTPVLLLKFNELQCTSQL